LDVHPICFLAGKDEVRCAEMLLTFVAGSFAATGGGYNIHPPGLSNSSADLVYWRSPDVDAFWKARCDFRARVGYWAANFRRECPLWSKEPTVAAEESTQDARAAELSEQNQALKDEINRLEAEVERINAEAEVEAEEARRLFEI
jgi:hypothetical protein